MTYTTEHLTAMLATIEAKCAKIEGHTPGPCECKDHEAYPGFKEIHGLSFRIPIVTIATDLDMSDYLQRIKDADLICAAAAPADGLLACWRAQAEHVKLHINALRIIANDPYPNTAVDNTIMREHNTNTRRIAKMHGTKEKTDAE